MQKAKKIFTENDILFSSLDNITSTQHSLVRLLLLLVLDRKVLNLYECRITVCVCNVLHIRYWWRCLFHQEEKCRVYYRGLNTEMHFPLLA